MLLLLNFEIILKIEKDLMLVRIDRMSWSKRRAAVPASFDGGALGREGDGCGRDALRCDTRTRQREAGTGVARRCVT